MTDTYSYRQGVGRAFAVEMLAPSGDYPADGARRDVSGRDRDCTEGLGAGDNAPSQNRRGAPGEGARVSVLTPENPPGFVVRTEAQKAAWDNGFRLERGVESGGWLRYGSTTAKG